MALVAIELDLIETAALVIYEIASDEGVLAPGAVDVSLAPPPYTCEAE